MRFFSTYLLYPLVLSIWTSLWWKTPSFAADSVVVFNEIHYHPADELSETEWIELHSLMGVDVDLSKWSIVGGVNFDFPEGTIMPGYGYLLLAADPANATLAGKNALGPWTGRLANGGESLRLENNSGRVMDEVSYGDDNDWPVGADGSGATLAKRNQGSADARPANWVSSPELGGTPGIANFPVAGEAPTVTEVITLDASWTYRDASNAPPVGWETSGFDDSAWAIGPGVFYAGSAEPTGAGEGLLGYWPLDETSGMVASNAVASGTDAPLFGGASWISDATRGQVLSFAGAGSYANAGSIPQLTTSSDFTWSFWAYDQGGGVNTVILGNRYSPSGAEFTPREFIKFTPTQFEWHRNGGGENIGHGGLPQNTWVHHAVVKSGSTITYYRDGAASGSRTIIQGLNNPQPFYFGGDQASESWSGRLDAPAIWERALPASSIAGIANETVSPLDAPTVEGAGSNLETELTLGTAAFYFRNRFVFSGNPARTSLGLQLLVDDGAVVYLNGVELHRENMPTGTVTHATLASAMVDDASLSSDMVLPANALVQGTNTVAVEVHQSAPADDDMVFAAVLELIATPPDPASLASAIVFSEIAAADEPGFQIELANVSTNDVDLGGYVIRSSSGAFYTLPAGLLTTGSHHTIAAATLGFTPVQGDRLFLLRPGLVELADARAVTNRLRGRAADGRWMYPTTSSFGAANVFAINQDIVINEIHYHPRFIPGQAAAASDVQWIEIHNRSFSNTVDLSGWEFTDGISYVFPPTNSLAAGGYLVVARDATQFSTNFPGVAVVGNFGGSLSRSGERLILRDANRNIADEVRFYDGGRWDGRADGKGSSLELRDPYADNAAAAAWAASDEATRSAWQIVNYTASGASIGNDPTLYHEFVMGLLDGGEVLVDDISVIEDPTGAARALIQDGNFTDGNFDEWRIIGTHRHSEVVSDPDAPANNVLRLRAKGGSEHLHNHAETTLKFGGNFVTINGALNYEISYRARLISGSGQLNTRLFFNRAARTTRLNAPSLAGTPGAANSLLSANIGPTYSTLAHHPVVPPANEPAEVRVTAHDPDGIDTLTLYYAVDGSAFAQQAMTHLGSGEFVATVPAQVGGAKVQFYIEAQDVLGAMASFPAAGPDSRAIIPWDDGAANLDYGDCRPTNVRIVTTDADANFMHALIEVMSNDRVGCTVILNEREIYYDCGARLKGSEHGRFKDARVGWNIRFPADQLFLGAHETIAIDRSGRGDSTDRRQREILVKHAINHAGGIPGMQDDLIRVIAPLSQHSGDAMLLKSRFDSEWLSNQFENGNDGTLWEYELIYDQGNDNSNPQVIATDDGTPEGRKIPQSSPGSTAGVSVGNLGSDPELYRHHWLIKNNKERDDYVSLIPIVTAIGQPGGAAFITETNERLDVDQWLRAFAVQVLFGVADNYAAGSQHNMLLYIRPSDGKAMYFPWDMDFTFSRGATASLDPNGDLRKLLGDPGNQRGYYGHLLDIMDTTFNATYMGPWATHYSCFVPGSPLDGFVSYISQRETYARGQINTVVPDPGFAITTNGGNPFSVSNAFVTLTGDAWVNLRELHLVGAPAALPITWLDNNTWQVSIPVAPGTHTYTLESYGFQGELLDSDAIELTGSGNVIPAAPGNLVISELMCTPIAGPNADADDYEFVELLNVDSSNTVDLTSVAFADGIDFTFPALTLAAGERVVVARRLAAFEARYGSGINTAGEYVALDDSNKLADGGERVILVDAVGNELTRFTYDNDFPWPISAFGEGYSLERINPTLAGPSSALPIHWRSSRSTNGTPGSADSDELQTWATGLGIVDFNLDPDGDGRSHFDEFMQGTDPFVLDDAEVASVYTNGALVLAMKVRNGADGILFGGAWSSDLNSWNPSFYAGRSNNHDGATSTLFFETPFLPSAIKGYIRALFVPVP